MFIRLCSLLFLLLIGAASFAQKIDSLMLIQKAADPQEKMYVHFDKNYYNPGESIWFKAYLFSGIEPSDISRNFYAELLDEQGNLISQKTAPVIFSGASGSFDIDSSFSKAAVYFRAYTISMLNSDTSFLYTKAIRILPAKNASQKASIAQAPPTISFLPEGGDLITGLLSTIAFKATNTQGLPIPVTGIINDNKGVKVADLQTLHDGMGKFSFLPEEGKTYTAVWKDAANKQYNTPLPGTKAQGIVLKLSDDDGNKRFTVYRSHEVPDAMKHLYLVGYMNQQVIFRANLNLATRFSATGIFPTQKVPTGILQVTVFDSAYTPLAERIAFVNNHDYEFDGDVFLSQKSFAKRGLNQVEITMSDTLPANLSLSIVDADLNEGNEMDDNIISHLLLTGDLRGKIANPYYYFFSNADSVNLHLDLVMLTHGWRRYNWPELLAGKTSKPRWKESGYLSMNGQLTGLRPGSISPDLELIGILQTADSAKNFIHLPVDRNGKVFTEGLIFYDNAKLFFNFNKKNMSFDKSMLMVDNGLRKGYNRALLDSMVKKGIADISAATIANNISTNKLSLQTTRLLANSRVMENITIRSKGKTAKDKMEDKYVGPGFTGDAKSFDLLNDVSAPGYMDIFQYLQGRVAGLQINTSGGTTTLSWRGGSPALYLNEMQTDASMISATPVSDIAYIKVFRPGESFMSGGGNGLIAIYTRKGGDAQPDPNAKGMSYVQMNGYSAVKDFYSPDYASFNERDGYDDVRSTLFWSPVIYLDKLRKRFRFKFYNNDMTKHFRLVLEGLNSEGKLIHVQKEVSAQ